jgi:hypothetical protein
VLPLTALTVYSVKQVRGAMQKVLKQDEPEFRSEEQEQAVTAVLNLDTLLVVVLPHHESMRYKRQNCWQL